MVGKPTLRINAIKLSNGAKASDSKEKTYSPTESEALAPKKEQKAYFIGIGLEPPFFDLLQSKTFNT